MQVLGKAEAAALAGSAEVVRSTLVTAGAIASGRVPVHLAQRPGGKVSGLLNAERLMVAKQLEQHFSMNGAATGAVLDSKVTGELHLNHLLICAFCIASTRQSCCMVPDVVVCVRC